MIYFKNWLFIIFVKVINKYGRFFFLSKVKFSSKRILEKNFKEKKKFNFIQVGANDGISFDFLYDFVIKRDSSGVVIEPVIEYFKELEHNYKDYEKIIKINQAVHPFYTDVIINRINPHVIQKYPDWVKGIASLDSKHHKKTGIDSNDIIQEKVKSDTLMNIIKINFYSNTSLDYLQIDTEGFDYEVIKMIDFSFIKPKIIKYEYVNLNKEDQNRVCFLLKKQGYYLFNEFGDTIGINLKNIKLI